jgi:hypothetical protein
MSRISRGANTDGSSGIASTTERMAMASAERPRPSTSDLNSRRRNRGSSNRGSRNSSNRNDGRHGGRNSGSPPGPTSMFPPADLLEDQNLAYAGRDPFRPFAIPGGPGGSRRGVRGRENEDEGGGGGRLPRSAIRTNRESVEERSRWVQHNEAEAGGHVDAMVDADEEGREVQHATTSSPYDEEELGLEGETVNVWVLAPIVGHMHEVVLAGIGHTRVEAHASSRWV